MPDVEPSEPDPAPPSARAWDQAAATFDESADHGLRAPDVRAAWTGLLSRALPAPPSRVADLGCGTGSLAVVVADLGLDVDGVDFSPRMLALARLKTAGRPGVSFELGDVAYPPLAPGGYDAVMCRHVLWSLPDPASALRSWSRLLHADGRVLLIEGRWSTGVGLPREETAALLRRCGFEVTIEPLDDPRYWGGPVSDDRYLVTGMRATS